MHPESQRNYHKLHQPKAGGEARAHEKKTRSCCICHDHEVQVHERSVMVLCLVTMIAKIIVDSAWLPRSLRTIFLYFHLPNHV